MSTDPEQNPLEDRPVAAGVRAVAVVAVVGAILAAVVLAILVKTSTTASERATFDAGMTLSMPAFSSEPADLDPVVLASVPPTTTSGPSDDSTYDPGSNTSYPPITRPSDQGGAYAINLQAGQRNVTLLLDLTGTYAKGEGAVLQIQQYVDGAWVDFAPPGQTGQMVVGGGLFSISITPQGKGLETFRVRNISNSDVSNSISVTVS